MGRTLNVLGLAVLSVGASAMRAQGASAFSGSWVVDPAQLQVSGPTFTFAVDKDGFSIRYSDGMGPKQVCDGQPQPVRPGYTRSCVKESSGGYTTTTTHDGKIVSKSEWELAAGGKELHERRMYTNPDDSEDKHEMTAVRVGTGTGMAGEWKRIAYTDSDFAKPVVFTGDTASLSILRPGQTKPQIYKLDGSELAMSNTVKISMRQDSARTLHERVSRDGKVFSERVLTLSSDGHSLTEVETHPSDPTDKTTTVYQKH